MTAVKRNDRDCSKIRSRPIATWHPASPPSRYRQCVVQESGQIAYLARTPGSAIFDGVAGEDKAALLPGLSRRTAFVADSSGDSVAVESNRLDRRIAAFERR